MITNFTCSSGNANVKNKTEDQILTPVPNLTDLLMKISSTHNFEATNLLNIISVLHPESIHTSFLPQMYQKLYSSEFRTEVFNILEEYSIFRTKKIREKIFISVDPVFQEMVRIRMETDGNGKLVVMLDKILQVVYQMLVANETSEKELIHINCVWKLGAMRQELVQKHKNLPDRIASKYEEAGRYTEGFSFSCAAADSLESVLGNEDRSTLTMKSWKCGFQYYMDDRENSLGNLKIIYEKQAKLFGEYDCHSLETSRKIAQVHWSDYNLKEANRWARNTLESWERFDNMTVNLETLKLKLIIAAVLADEGDLETALSLYEEIYQKYETIFGENYYDLLVIKHNMAWILEQKGKLDESMLMYKDVLEIRENVYGKNHPLALGSRENLEKLQNKERQSQ